MSELAGWAAVGVLAAIGAVARFTVHDAVQRRSPVAFPLGILVVNVTGSFALGVLAGVGLAGWSLRLAGGALLGSYTTFSTWMLDAQQLHVSGAPRRAVLDVAGSVLLGVAAVAAGWAAGGLL